MVLLLLSPLILIPLAIIAVILKIIFFIRKTFIQPKSRGRAISIGIFHPYSNGGGGGERVLWCLVHALQQMNPECRIYLYTGQADVMAFEDLKKKVKNHFNIELPRKIELVGLKSRDIIESTGKWRFTLFAQSIASAIVGIEALVKYTPDVFIDSMGYAFTFPIAKIAGCKVACYVHYPTISTDMLSKVQKRVTAYNNDTSVSASPLKTFLKVTYYKLFAKLYGFMGYFADEVMVNSTWTHDHIAHLWWLKKSSKPNTKFDNLHIVYPPVNVTNLLSIPLSPEKRKPYILSVGQFREEKDHPLQLKAFAHLLKTYEETNPVLSQAKLCLLGGCRDENDRNRVKGLRELAEELGITNQVEFFIDAKFEKLVELLSESCIGLHAMWNEHFGICIVEYMAAGLIPLAHNSGGPKSDIVVPLANSTESTNITGYLADSVETYAKHMNDILLNFFKQEKSSERQDLIQVQKNAREKSKEYSEEVFSSQVRQHLSSFVQ